MIVVRSEVNDLKTTSIHLNMIYPRSFANGPGSHFTIWAQGCTLNCEGCFNKEMHNSNNGFSLSLSLILDKIKFYWEQNLIRGVTFTGGEPFQQFSAVLALAENIKKLGDIGIIILTGYEQQELEFIPEFPYLTNFVDILISGRFLIKKKLEKGLRGSKNKQYLVYSDFYSIQEFDQIPVTEIIPFDNGSYLITGTKPSLAYKVLENEYK